MRLRRGILRAHIYGVAESERIAEEHETVRRRRREGEKKGMRGFDIGGGKTKQRRREGYIKGEG